MAGFTETGGSFDPRSLGDKPQQNTAELLEIEIEPTTAETSAESSPLSKLVKEQFSGNEPEAIFVLSGGIVTDSVARVAPYNDDFKSPSFADSDRLFADAGKIIVPPGGKTRVIAATEIAKEFSDMTIVTTSIVPGEFSHASVMATELRGRGIEDKRIILEEDSLDTWTEMVELVKMTVKQGWGTVGIITNQYHVPRAQAMLDNLEQYLAVNPDAEASAALQKVRTGSMQIKFLAAEKVLESVNPHWSTLFERTRTTAAYQKTQQNEANGLEALRTGTYVYRTRSPRQA